MLSLILCEFLSVILLKSLFSKSDFETKTVSKGGLGAMQCMADPQSIRIQGWEIQQMKSSLCGREGIMLRFYWKLRLHKKICGIKY